MKTTKANITAVMAASIKPGNLPYTHANEASIKSILSIVFNIAGALALLIIVVSGLRYITSAGDPEKAGRAKNGIIYAVIGLAVAISAQAIVAFALKGF